MPAKRPSQATKSTAGGRPKPGDTTKKKRSVASSSEGATDSTPARVVDAAIACILEEGFYRASSNEIARRADVTWGVIQYHFGSREALLLAVLERAVEHLQATLEAAHIEADTLEDRLGLLADVVWSYYGQPQFLAYIQVMLNLSHDPSTEQQTRDAIRENQLHVSHHLPRVLQEALGDDVPANHRQAAAMRNFVFSALRGLAIDQAHIAALPRDTKVDPRQHHSERTMLVRALALQVSAAMAAG
jgi:AcrR family transcriptional regulator